jgi:histidinol-phosphate aminotransferase
MASTNALSRRGFGRLLGLGVAAAGLRPGHAARALSTKPRAASGVVRLSSNENPYGPSPAALQAVRDAFSLAWRYPDEAADELIADLAKLHGLPAESFLLGAGSSEILKLAASAFSDATRKVVMADPSFEAIGQHARVCGAEVVKVPLDAAFAHDLEAMAAVPSAGLIYVCNPNNPTASLTPKAKLRAFLGAAPAQVTVLVDEAYHHYIEDPEYESVAPLIKAHPNLIVSRTFSKIYGMAGLRLGYAIAQPATIKRLAEQGAFDSVNILALAAARASLVDPAHTAQGKQRNAATRAQAVADVRALGLAVIPSHANFFMIAVKKPVAPIIAALQGKGVQVGRLFPALPMHLRVTVGTPEQMQRFIEAFAATMAFSRRDRPD